MQLLFKTKKNGNSAYGNGGYQISGAEWAKPIPGVAILVLLMLLGVRPPTCHALLALAPCNGPRIGIDTECEKNSGCTNVNPTVTAQDQQSGEASSSSTGSSGGNSPSVAGGGATAASSFAPRRDEFHGGASPKQDKILFAHILDELDGLKRMYVSDIVWSFDGSSEFGNPTLGCKIINADGFGHGHGWSVRLKAGKKAGTVRLKATIYYGSNGLGLIPFPLFREVRIESQLLKGCRSCGDETISTLGSAGMGNNNGPDFQLPLGHDSPWEDAGIIRMKANTPSASLATPDVLTLPYFNPNTQTAFYPASGAMQQVRSAQGLVTIQTDGSYKYHMRVYDNDNFDHGPGTSIPYSTTANGEFVKWTVENPGGASSNTSLWITETRGSLVRTNKYSYENDAGTMKWVLSDNAGVRTTKSWETVNGTQTTKVREVWKGTTLLERLEQTFDVIDGHVELLSSTEGSGADARTTTYTFYPSSGSYGNNLNRLYKVAYPDGAWVIYTYDSSQRVIKEYSPLGNTTAPANYSEPSATGGQLTEYEYTIAGGVDDGSYAPDKPRKTSVKVAVSGNWVEIGCTYAQL